MYARNILLNFYFSTVQIFLLIISEQVQTKYLYLWLACKKKLILKWSTHVFPIIYHTARRTPKRIGERSRKKRGRRQNAGGSLQMLRTFNWEPAINISEYVYIFHSVFRFSVYTYLLLLYFFYMHINLNKVSILITHGANFFKTCGLWHCVWRKITRTLGFISIK